jgi:hypothetical protein
MQIFNLQPNLPKSNSAYTTHSVTEIFSPYLQLSFPAPAESWVGQNANICSEWK